MPFTGPIKSRWRPSSGRTIELSLYDSTSGGLTETVIVAEMITPCIEKIALRMWVRMSFAFISCRIAVEEATLLSIDVIGGQHIGKDKGRSQVSSNHILVIVDCGNTESVLSPTK